MSVKLRYRESKKTGLFSAYLDIYQNYNREYEYLDIFVSQDYSKVKKIKENEKDKVELAQKICLRRELEIKEGKYGFGNKHLRKTEFMPYLETIHKKKGHDSYHNLKRKLEGYLKEEKITFPDFDEERVKHFIKYLTASVSEATAYHYIKILNVVFNCAVRDKIIVSNPISFIEKEDKPKKIQAQRSYLTIEELRQLNTTEFKGNQQIKAAFLFSCFTGLRISDVKKLKWDQVDEATEQLQFRQKKSIKDFQYLPLQENAKKIIQDLPKPEYSDYVFWNLPGSNSYTNILLRVWAAEAGIKKHVHWHCGRHTYACLLLANGVDIYTVSKLLGHYSVSETEIYAKVMDESKKKAVNKLPSLSSDGKGLGLKKKQTPN